MARRYREITDLESGLVFRFLYDLGDPARLHIEARWDSTPEEAIAAFFAGREHAVWIERKHCFETLGECHVVVWLWLDEAHTRVLVITCVPHEQSQ